MPMMRSSPCHERRRISRIDTSRTVHPFISRRLHALRRQHSSSPSTHVRITYFADVRFPLERANGIQTMETCHALATRGARRALDRETGYACAGAGSICLLRAVAGLAAASRAGASHRTLQPPGGSATWHSRSGRARDGIAGGCAADPRSRRRVAILVGAAGRSSGRRWCTSRTAMRQTSPPRCRRWSRPRRRQSPRSCGG